CSCSAMPNEETSMTIMRTSMRGTKIVAETGPQERGFAGWQRLATCKGWLAGRLPVGETADYQSALQSPPDAVARRPYHSPASAAPRLLRVQLAVVAQTGSLLFRRLATVGNLPATDCRLAVSETADCQSVLQLTPALSSSPRVFGFQGQHLDKAQRRNSTPQEFSHAHAAFSFELDFA